MALSKPVDPGVVQDIQVPVIAQHYLVCGSEECKNNCLFYCNPCHQQMCEQCRDEHQKSPATKNHEVVPYRQRKRKLPVEKCKDHPSKDIDMICENCQVAVCSKCSIRDHRGHTFDDLETTYSKNFTLCLDEIYKINQYYIPRSRDMKKDIEENVCKIKLSMDKIKTSIKAEAESFKSLVEKVMLDNLEQANEMEETLVEKLQSQNKTYEEYCSYLKNLVKQLQGYLSFDQVQNNPILFSFSEQINIKPIPETTDQVLPVFTAGQCTNDIVAKLMGTVTAPKTKPAIKPTKNEMKPIKPTTKNLRKLVPIEILSLSSSVTKVKEYKVAGVDCVYHISGAKSGRLCVSDQSSNLVQTDIQGKQIQRIKTSGKDEGYHTVTLNGDLLFTDRKKSIINRISHEKTITKFITTGDWIPISIHSSRINGDILVGTMKDRKGKVTRYNKTGKEIQNIQKDNIGKGLYSEYPYYITENANGDICVSDCGKHAVVVVNKSGRYRFSYKGQGSGFIPYGICTDKLGYILVCDTYSKTLQLLDKGGRFLSFLITIQHGIEHPRSVCVDDENNIHLGQNHTNTVIVFEYLQ